MCFCPIVNRKFSYLVTSPTCCKVLRDKDLRTQRWCVTMVCVCGNSGFNSGTFMLEVCICIAVCFGFVNAMSR